ncbi:hypothetical protein ACM66B_005211 [Microbotryomycetes sp. NB124-2]
MASASSMLVKRQTMSSPAARLGLVGALRPALRPYIAPALVRTLSTVHDRPSLVSPRLVAPRGLSRTVPVRFQSTSSSSSSPATDTSSSSTSPPVTQSDTDSSSSSKAVVSSSSSSSKKGTRLQRIWANIKKEAQHYWHGTKLLGKEIRISARIQGRLLAGKKLTRRERRQLKRTTQDLLRLIPFSVFLIVPFMELLLPVALKLFPNMLPSTFTDKFKEEEKKRKLLKVRLEMAKFLQETIRESGITSRNKIKESEEFKEFFRKVRSTGEEPTTDEIVKVAKLFEDDLTLDNLSRPQLVSMCRYMNINAFGTDNFLRYTIRSRMRQIKEDDKVINAEGIEALSLDELKHACQSRGIRTHQVSEENLRNELGQWITLHVERGLSGTLMMLSKAFGFNRMGDIDAPGEKDQLVRSLKHTLASLPDNLVNETELEVSSDSASYKQRLEVLQQQEELIEDEEEQEAKESEARRLKKEQEEDAKREAEERKKAEEELKRKEEEEKRIGEEKEQAQDMLPEQEADAAQKEDAAAAAAAAAEEQAAEDIRMTSEQVTELGQALEILSAKSSVMKEREEVRKLIDENRKAEEGGESNPLSKRLKNILAKIDKQLEEYDNSVGSRLNVINVDYQGRIARSDLKIALESIAHRPSDEAVEVLLEKLDVDHDNFVPLQDIIALAEGEGLGIVISDEAEAERDKIQGDVHEAVDELRRERKPVTKPNVAEEVSKKELKEVESSSTDGSSSSSGSKKKDEPKLKKEDVVES